MSIDLYKKQSIRQVLEERGLSLKKRWGQNFLVNKSIAEKIVNSLVLLHTRSGKDPTIWEIGPGLGSLSELLLQGNGQLAVFEIDFGIIRFLEEFFASELEAEKLSIVAGDAEKSLGERVRSIEAEKLPDLLCGNLPYRSASRILIQVCSEEKAYVPAVYMVQKEVAERLIGAGTDYGITTILVQSLYTVSKLFSVGPDSFFPAPFVASTVLQFLPKNTDHMGNEIFEILKQLVRAAFSQRRKKLGNTLLPELSVLLQESGESAHSVLDRFEIDVHKRAEDISVEQYRSLAIYLKSRLS